MNERIIATQCTVAGAERKAASVGASFAVAAAFRPSRGARSSDLGKIIVIDINENQHHSRTSRFTLLIAVGIFFGIGVILYWAESSDLVHISTIKHTLGL